MLTSIGLLVIAIIAAIAFGFFISRLVFVNESTDGADLRSDSTENYMLSWVARQSVADLANHRPAEIRVTAANVLIAANQKVRGAFVCTIDDKNWQAIVFKIRVEKITMTRFVSSVYCSEHGKTLFFTGKYELDLRGFEEKIEVG